MQGPLLSIIIPSYNGGAHIRSTLDSVLLSGIEEFETEILLIDDGSSDDTASICADYQYRYPSLFRYYFKSNGGLSSARNLGIKEAKGDYLFFLDDDDILRPGSFSFLYDHYFDDKFDVLGFSSDTIDYNSDVIIDKGSEGSIVFEGDGLDYMSVRTPTFVWQFWYRRSFIIRHSINFTIYYPEDTMFNLLVFRLNPKVRITTQKVICYLNYHEDGQLTKNRDPENMRRVSSSYMTYFEELSSSRHNYQLSTHAVNLAFQSQIIPFLSRCLSSNLTKKEFASYKTRLEDYSLLCFDCHAHKLSRIAVLILHTPLLFPIYKYLYKTIFQVHFLPKLSRG